MSRVNWNPEYIKGKKPIKNKIVGVAHNHSGGFYSGDCPGCLAENDLTPNILAIDINKLMSSSSSSGGNDNAPKSNVGDNESE